MKVFLDTNVWLSAIVFPGLCAELLTVLDDSSHTLLTSELVKAEVLEVLQRKFPRHEEAQALFVHVWQNHAFAIADVAEPADDADARLVKAAALAGTDLFATGDQRVLGWAAQGTMQIVSPRTLYEILR